MSLNADALESGQGNSTDVDRYPTLADALARLREQLPDADLVVDRVEMSFLANGECNCKWWTPRAEEPEFVFIPAPETNADSG